MHPQRLRFLTKAPVALAAVGALALAGCGGQGTGSGGMTAAHATSRASVTPSPSASATPSPSPSTSKTPPLSATSDDPHEVAVSLKDQIPEIGAVVKITEDNDANNLIGRPGQYDAATFMQDKRLPCTAQDQYDDLSIDCGAKVERWASNKDAVARTADIQQKLKDYGLGAEYDYVRGGLVLRISGDIKPSEAKKYTSAFAGERAP